MVRLGGLIEICGHSPPYNPGNMLLDEIIELATDASHPLTLVLRKCLILGYQLKNDRLKSWANQELNGYQSREELPAYRVLHIGAHGNFAGPIQRMNDFAIPSFMLDESDRDWAQKVELQEAVSSYEELVSRDASGSMYIEWPGNMIAKYQRKLFQGQMSLIKAWQSVPRSVLVQVLDTVRNRTLNMALELKNEIGQTEDIKDISLAEGAKIEQTIINNIFGGTAYLASGHGTINATTNTQNIIAVGDRAQLDSVLKKVGLSDDDLKELTEAEHSDGSKKMGSRVMDLGKKECSEGGNRRREARRGGHQGSLGCLSETVHRGELRCLSYIARAAPNRSFCKSRCCRNIGSPFGGPLSECCASSGSRVLLTCWRITLFRYGAAPTILAMNSSCST